MRLLTLSTSFSLCFLLAKALPISEPRSEPQLVRRKPTYSVVPVDGGQPGDSAPPKTEVVTRDSTKTITEPPMTIPPVTETILSTTIVTESEHPTTILTTITTISTPVTTQAPPAGLSPSITTTLTTVTSLVSTVDTLIITTISTPSLTPYDDGMWHTTYYKPAEPSPSSVASSSASPIGTPSPGNDIELPASTGSASNGTVTLVPRSKNIGKPPKSITRSAIPTNGVAAAIKTRPPMPTLPKTSEILNPTEIPSIDVGKHLVPGFGR